MHYSATLLYALPAQILGAFAGSFFEVTFGRGHNKVKTGFGPRTGLVFGETTSPSDVNEQVSDLCLCLWVDGAEAVQP